MNTGAIDAVTVISIVAGDPHWPAAGVNVYVIVPAAAVLIVAGAHVPEIPLLEVSGRAGGVDPWQSGPIGSNTGAIDVVTVMSIVAGDPH